jgi:peptidoglycan/LPS O-acetylase OafA/YrhL
MTNNPPQITSTISYRPDIEGLRGLAVILVMLLHFNVASIGGGFIGVDIFFVISGFLITSIIHQKQSTDGFSFTDFYNRRIKRLAPNTILVVCVTTAFFSTIMLPDDFINYFRTVRDVFLFDANSRFEKDLGNYFAKEAEALPLLHTWSLAVEWQFYFMFPVVLYVIQKTVKNPLYVLLPLLVISLGYSIYQVQNGEDVYFSTFARIFEFLVGACAVFMPFKIEGKRSTILTYMALIGLGVISFVYDAETPFPGVYAFPVTLAVFIILVSGYNNYLLTSRAMVHAGKLSYSAYLWHWPLAAACYLLGHQTNGLMLLPLILLTFALSQIGYMFVENPLRRVRFRFRTTLLLFIIVPAFVSVSSFYIVRKLDGLPQRLGEQHGIAFEMIQSHKDPQRDHCQTFKGTNLEECAFGDKSNNEYTALLLGDSHASHIKGFIEVLAKDAGLKGYLQTDSACLMLLGEFGKTKRAGRDQSCTQKTEELYGLIESGKFDLVIFSQRWRGYGGDADAYTASLKESIEFVINARAQPVVVYPVAEAEGGKIKNLNQCFYQNIKQPEVCDISRESSNKKLQRIYMMFEAVEADFPSLITVDPQKVQCDAGVCITHYKGIPLYEDIHHIFDYTAKLFAERYLDTYANPLDIIDTPD